MVKTIFNDVVTMPRINFFSQLAIFSILVTSCKESNYSESKDPLIIQEQGSFAVGGTVITNPGTFDQYNQTQAGQTFHGDHAYVFYQIPPGQDGWRARLEMARLWRDAVNRHGGDVTVVHLPEILQSENKRDTRYTARWQTGCKTGSKEGETRRD